jgi:hypothetical protein
MSESQVYKLSFNGFVIDYYHRNGILFLEAGDPSLFNHPLTIAQVILRDYVQNSLGTTPKMDGNDGDFIIEPWELFPGDETRTATHGFRFYASGENFRLNNTFEGAIRHARFCAWHSRISEENLDYCVVSRFSFQLQRMEYDVIPAIEDLSSHEFWLEGYGNPRIEATFYCY